MTDHKMNTDQYLDKGGMNEVSAAQIKELMNKVRDLGSTQDG